MHIYLDRSHFFRCLWEVSKENALLFFALTLIHVFISLSSLKYNTEISVKDQDSNKQDVEPEIT